jgi:hypothetical protein
MYAKTCEKPNAPRPPVLVIRTDRRSWLVLAISGFGAVLLRYLRVVRERGRTLRLWSLLILIGILLLVSFRTLGR